MPRSISKIIFKNAKMEETLVIDLGLFAHDNMEDLLSKLREVDTTNPITVGQMTDLVEDVFKDSNSKVNRFNDFSLSVKAQVDKENENKIITNDPISQQATMINAIQDFVEGLVVVTKVDDSKKEGKDTKDKFGKKENNDESEKIKESSRKPNFLKSKTLVTESDGLMPSKDEEKDSKTDGLASKEPELPNLETSELKKEEEENREKEEEKEKEKEKI